MNEESLKPERPTTPPPSDAEGANRVLSDDPHVEATRRALRESGIIPDPSPESKGGVRKPAKDEKKAEPREGEQEERRRAVDKVQGLMQRPNAPRRPRGRSGS